MHWYQREVGQVFEDLNTSEHGLSDSEAKERLQKFGVFFQFFQAWNCRSEIQSLFSMNPLSNPFLLFCTIGAFLAHLGAIYVPAMQWLFRMEPIMAAEWLRIVLMSLTVVLAVEIDKWLRRRHFLAFA